MMVQFHLKVYIYIHMFCKSIFIVQFKFLFTEFKRIVHDFDVAYGEKVRDLYDQIDVDHDHKITKEGIFIHFFHKNIYAF